MEVPVGSGAPAVQGSRPPVVWFSRRSVAMHVTVATVVAGCLVAAWWQATRALSGNALSWIYSIEWPLFAGYAVFLWWRMLHEGPPAPIEPRSRPAESELPSLRADDDDPERAAYNRYLAELDSRGARKSWTSR